MTILNFTVDSLAAKAAAAASYVDSLKLPETPDWLAKAPPSRRLLKVAADGSPKGAVVDGSLVACDSTVSAQHNRDVLNSTLLAQLAANKAFSRDADCENWYKKYREVLESIGWVINNFSFTEFDSHGNSFQMSDVVINILKSIAGGAGRAEIAQAAIDALKALPEGDHGRVLWDHSSSNTKKGAFQISAASEVNGNVQMSLGCFHFEASQSSTSILWFNYSSNSCHLYTDGESVTLNEQIYATVRQKVIDRLGDRISQYIDDLDI